MLYNLFENRDFVSVFAVALLAEGVDRNQTVCLWRCFRGVALLAEGVDRNFFVPSRLLWEHVALLAEGVDRNIMLLSIELIKLMSPSSRRAWIEIDRST